jgi:hypothetical protein
MNDFSISRKEILLALQTLLEPLPEVRAFWQGGAAAFNRVDEWSDLDLMVIADDEKVDHVQKLIESQLKKLSPIQNQLDLPQPTWHGHLQSFYRLEHASPFLFIDLLIMQASIVLLNTGFTVRRSYNSIKVIT